jgi:hypothetical protein
MATRKFRKFSEGGEAADKEAGLKASKDEKVGFFERLRMGNIDQEGSEAYNRFGAGRGKAERTPVEDRVATPVNRSMAAAPEMDAMQEANTRVDRMLVPNQSVEDQPKPGGRPRVNVQASNPSASKPSAPAKSSPKMQEQTYRRTSGDTGDRGPAYTRNGGATADELANYKPAAKNPNYSNEGRGREMTKEQQFARADAEARSPEGVARRKKQEAEQGLERVTPETALLPAGGLKAMHGAAKKLAERASKKLKTYDQPALPGPKREALPSPTKRLEYDKAGAVARKRAERAEARKNEMLKENARRYGLDKDAPGYEAASGSIRKDLGGKDFSLKRGGSIAKSSKPAAKGWGMARGARAAKIR